MKQLFTIISIVILLGMTNIFAFAQETAINNGPEEAAFSHSNNCLLIDCINTSTGTYTNSLWVFDVAGKADSIWAKDAAYEFGDAGTYEVSLTILTASGTLVTIAKEILIDDCSEVVTSTFLADLTANEQPIKAYPNPARDHIHFVVAQPESGMTLKIYSLLGQQMNQLTDLNGELTLHLDDYVAGIYFYHLIAADGSVVEMDRFIVK